MKRLLLLAIALIVYGSLYPWQFNWWRSGESPVSVLLRSWPDHIDRWMLRDIALNIPLYSPLGLLAYLAFARRHSRALAASLSVWTGAALSIAMELLQVYVPGRVSSLLDVSCNVAGTAVGAAAGLVFESRIAKLRGRRHRLASAAVLLLACLAVSQLYPFFPDISRTKLHRVVSVISTAPVSAVEVWADGAEWFAALTALAAIAGRPRAWWAALAPVAVGARMFVATRYVTVDEAAGVLLAAVAWAAIPDRWKLQAAAWWMTSAVVLRELAPFHFVEQATPFQWIPFVPTLDSERQSAVVIIARKAFDYGAAVWLLRSAGMRYRWAGLATAVALFLFELAQTHISGRTPEITDAVLALLMTAMLWLCDWSGSEQHLHR